MKILAIESSATLLHIALKSEDFYISQTKMGSKNFSEELMSEIVLLAKKVPLKLKDLDLVLTSEGPGSFTSLRVGYATAKGIAFGSNIPLVSVSTTEVLAYPLRSLEMPVLAALDAKKRRYYCALFNQGKRLSADIDGQIKEIVTLIAPYGSIMVAGPDAQELSNKICDEVTKQGIKTKIYADYLKYRDLGESMIEIGKKLFLERGADPPNKGPTYIRKSDAEVSLEDREKRSKEEQDE